MLALNDKNLEKQQEVTPLFYTLVTSSKLKEFMEYYTYF